MDVNTPFSIKTSFWQKIALVLFGVLITLALLEIGLRIGGGIFVSLQEHRNRVSLSRKGTYRIMCVGESTTAMGGNASYPSQLEKILNGRHIGISFSVINKGRAGTITGFIVSQIESCLDEYHPDMVVAMMGINDGGTCMPYERPTSSEIIVFIRSMRTYKLARFLLLHLEIKVKEIRLYKPRKNKPPAQERQPDLFSVELKKAHVEQADHIAKENMLKKALELNPKNEEAYLELGRLCRTRDQFERAEDNFKKALKLNPKNEEAYLELARLYRDYDQFERAEDNLKKALELNPKNEESYLALGRLYRGYDQFERAEDNFKKALELNPKNDVASIALGELYRYYDQFERAEDNLKKALELNPKNDAIYLELARLCRTRDQFERAEDNLKKALELNPNNEGAYLELGQLYRHQGQLQQAERWLREGLKSNPKLISPILCGALATLYEETGRIDLAQRYYKKTKELWLDWNSPVTTRNYHALKEILAKRKIKLVCVQYPMCSVGILKKIFEGQEGMIFVDNEKIFKEAVKREGYKEYFKDIFAGNFGHCTVKGNFLLAENIARAILKEVFFR